MPSSADVTILFKSRVFAVPIAYSTEYSMFLLCVVIKHQRDKGEAKIENSKMLLFLKPKEKTIYS